MIAFEELKEYKVIAPHGILGHPGYRVATYLDGQLESVIECAFLQDVLTTVHELRSRGYQLKTTHVA